VKKILIALTLLILLFAGAWGFGKQRQAALREMVDRAASSCDPAALEQNGGSSFVSYAVLPDRTHTGFVNLPDGEKVKFWFRSHHLPPGKSYTRFDFNDGTRNYFEGSFCCEVMLPEVEVRSREELLEFLQRNEGKKP
jgi:hypothetical protein